MTNALVKVENNIFTLVDVQGTTLFSGEEWQDVVDFAEQKDINIQFEPKDLVFDFDPHCSDGPYIYFDIKYGEGGHDNLGEHNVINLPKFIETSELTECTFAYDDEISDQDVIAQLQAVGATYKKFL